MSSQQRSVRAVELAIIASEGMMIVDGIPYSTYGGAELARRALAQRAIAEGALLCRYLRLEPPCAWCCEQIKPTHASREIDGRLFHDMDGRPCANEFENNAGSYTADRPQARGPILDGRPIATL